jgi:exodeoxyribonuclease-5
LAGTGKTGLVTHLGGLHSGVQYVASTGKAASVLRQRGAENATTIHSLLYGAPEVLKNKAGRNNLRWVKRTEPISASLIVADECSMIDSRLALDLLDTGIPLLVTGDLMQLPPVNGAPFFTEPDFELTEIHRQVEGSQPLRHTARVELLLAGC